MPISRFLPSWNDLQQLRDGGESVDQALNLFSGLVLSFSVFIDSYKANFTGSTRPVMLQAQQYLCGLIQAKDKNMERMAEVVPDSDEQVLQHFLTNSPWSYRSVMDQVALVTNNISQWVVEEEG